jgi:NADPH2:quinone reductase
MPTMNAIVVERFGPPEVLKLQEVPRPVPGPGEVRVRLAAIGVNFSETERRRAVPHYAGLKLPWIPGGEGAGTIEAVGEGGDADLVGARVAFWAPPSGVSGTYAEWATVSLHYLFWLPPSVGFPEAAALALQGLTAYGLAHLAAAIAPGETVLVHAAGGGIGLLLTQMARRAGARVLGTVSSPGKGDAVLDAGGEPLPYGPDLPALVREATGGRGADLVFDSVGKATQEASLAALAPYGRLVFYGEASGPAEPICPGDLYDRCLSVSAFGLDLDRHPEQWETARQCLLDGVADDTLSLKIDRVFPLPEAAAAHERLESRRAVGKILLVP